MTGIAQSTNLVHSNPFWGNFQFSEEKIMQYLEKIANFGHFSGPFRLRNDQICFYTLNNDTNSPAHLFSRRKTIYGILLFDFGRFMEQKNLNFG